MSKNEVIKANGNTAAIRSALIEIVGRNDIDPERLEKFLDLQVKMEDRQARQDFNAAMAGFQGECPNIPKSKKVNFKSKSGSTTQYDYAPLDEMRHHIMPYLKKWGLSYTFDIKPGDATSTLLTNIRHIGGHCEVFTYDFPTIHDDSRMNLSQRRKSSLSFAKRAGLENALGLVTVDCDTDARHAIDKMITEDQIEIIKGLMNKTETKEDQLFEVLGISELVELSEYEAKSTIHKLKQKRIIRSQKK